MLFNTLAFWLFLAVVLALYLGLPRRAQNVLLLVASYVFYACWNWRFVGLLVLSTTVDWTLANLVAREPTRAGARRWVAASVAVNLTFLGFFKYWNFFADSAATLLRAFGLDAFVLHLAVVLPVGISFYTFQSISYIVDVYRGDVPPARDPVDFALFVAFFPHMVAGPIMHSRDLLPQMQQDRHLSWIRAMDGFHLAAWGLFKKVVIADNLAVVANQVFAGDLGTGPGVAHAGALAFAIQIYGDFSGYTDIARGVARILGFELMQNFDHPYAATSIADFWHRWHISLSTWLRDYLYIPLGGSRDGRARTYRNLFLTMLLGGLWHGAAWRFVIWGAYQGALLCVERALGLRSQNASRAATLVRWVVTFHLVLVGWIIFRCEDVPRMAALIASFADVRGWVQMPAELAWPCLGYTALLLPMECAQLLTGRELVLLRAPVPARALAYVAGIYLFVLLGAFESNAFIYFQF